jgi:hypothetical protein
LNAIVNPQIGPLTWQEQKPIGMISAAGTLVMAQQEEREIFLMESENSSTGLFGFMRENTPHDAIASVVVTYEDSHGRKFSREFHLTSEVDGGIDWRPCPVKLL